VSELIRIGIEVYYKEVDIEVSYRYNMILIILL